MSIRLFLAGLRVILAISAGYDFGLNDNNSSSSAIKSLACPLSMVAACARI